jgi:hypothetical protein
MMAKLYVLLDLCAKGAVGFGTAAWAVGGTVLHCLGYPVTHLVAWELLASGALLGIAIAAMS